MLDLVVVGGAMILPLLTLEDGARGPTMLPLLALRTRPGGGAIMLPLLALDGTEAFAPGTIVPLLVLVG